MEYCSGGELFQKIVEKGNNLKIKLNFSMFSRIRSIENYESSF
jgi:hypothetical protein